LGHGLAAPACRLARDGARPAGAVLRHRRRVGAEPAGLVGAERGDPPQDPGRQSGATLRFLRAIEAARRRGRRLGLGVGALLTRRLAPIGAMLALALLMAGCAAPTAGPTGPGGFSSDAHVPPYARLPYQPFSREAAIQIAYREWRAFGQPVVLPHTELPFDNERAEGLWQRVGDYWWLGLSLGDRDQGFTGMHDQNGRIFSAAEDENFAWSAAFIDYVMRMAGAGRRFPYSSTHSD